jgi:hypothetical protein
MEHPEAYLRALTVPLASARKEPPRCHIDAADRVALRPAVLRRLVWNHQGHATLATI